MQSDYILINRNELADLVTKTVRDALQQKRLVYGINGIAQLFGVSRTMANNIKRSGVINRAIKQRGRTIITDADLALELWGQRGRRKTL
jgi:hypothetical protein